jgi:AraC-like DNA-binding protein
LRFFEKDRVEMSNLVEEQIRWWKPQGIPGIEALSVQGSQRLWKVFHESITVCTVLDIDGFSEWDCRGRRYTSGRGSLMLMDQGEIHNTRKVSAPGTFWVLFLDDSYIRRIAEEILGTAMPRWRFADFRDPGAYRSFVNLHTILQSDLPTLGKETHLLACVSKLLSQATEKSPHPVPRIRKREVLRRAMDFLQARFSEDVRLDELAYHSCTTPSHLCHSFASAFGVPPHQYLLRLRIAKAKVLLAKGVPFQPADLGFSDQFQFNRIFRQVYGITPRNYQVQLRIPMAGGLVPA